MSEMNTQEEIMYEELQERLPMSIRYVIQKRDWKCGKWLPVKVFLDRQLAEKYMQNKNKLHYRIFED